MDGDYLNHCAPMLLGVDAVDRSRNAAASGYDECESEDEDEDENEGQGPSSMQACRGAALLPILHQVCLDRVP